MLCNPTQSSLAIRHQHPGRADQIMSLLGLLGVLAMITTQCRYSMANNVKLNTAHEWSGCQAPVAH